MPGQERQISMLMRRAFKLIVIELSRDGGVTFEPVGTINNTHKARWARNTLPWLVTGPASVNCLLRATMAQRKGPVSILSATFSIGTTQGGGASAPGPAGPIGPQGVEGAAGSKGDTGAQGVAGPQGTNGAQGLAGLKGDTGAQGSAGPQGSGGGQGAAGQKGDTGAQGLVGPQGPVGGQGVAGLKGDTGDFGSMGPAGPQGAQGIQGGKGDPGIQGSVGPQGLTGAQGAAGPAGPPGCAGPQGVAGPAGPQGSKGETGPTGPTGPPGPTAIPFSSPGHAVFCHNLTNTALDHTETINDGTCKPNSCIIVTYIGGNKDAHITIKSESSGVFVVALYATSGTFSTAEGLNYIIVNPL